MLPKATRRDLIANVMLFRAISETVKAIVKVTKEYEYEVICDL